MFGQLGDSQKLLALAQHLPCGILTQELGVGTSPSKRCYLLKLEAFQEAAYPGLVSGDGKFPRGESGKCHGTPETERQGRIRGHLTQKVHRDCQGWEGMSICARWPLVPPAGGEALGMLWWARNQTP